MEGDGLLSPVGNAVSMMANDKAQEVRAAKLLGSTVVFLTGQIEETMRWYEGLGFTAEYYPPGFGILRRDAIAIFLQQQNGYVKPDDPGARARQAWNVYIDTDDVEALFAELSRRPDVNIVRGLSRQEYGQIEFDVMDPNGYRLVFAQPAN
jgi:hypothetical protein